MKLVQKDTITPLFLDEPGTQEPAEQQVWVGVQKLVGRTLTGDENMFPISEEASAESIQVKKNHPWLDVQKDAKHLTGAGKNYARTIEHIQKQEEEGEEISDFEAHMLAGHETIDAEREEIFEQVEDVLRPVFERHDPRTISMLTALLEGPVRKKVSEELIFPVDAVLEALYDLELNQAYERHEIPKKNNPKKKRVIHSPREELKRLQRRLNDRLLRFAYLHNIAFGFREKIGAVHGLKSMLQHFEEVPIHSAWAIDVDDFFGRVDTEKLTQPVHRLVKALLHQRKNGPQLPEKDCESIADLIIELCTVADEEIEGRRHVVQGAPTSPSLSNIVATKLDEEIMGAVKGMRHTLQQRNTEQKVALWAGRYADDIAFYSSHKIEPSFKNNIRRMCEEHGFPLKPSKERGVNFAKNPNRAAFQTWGCSVKPARNENEVNRFSVTNKMFKRIRGMLHKAVNDGDMIDQLMMHETRSDFCTDKFVAKIFGMVGYASFVYRNGGEWDPEYPVLPKHSHQHFVDFIEMYSFILQEGEERLTEQERNDMYMGVNLHPFSVRRDEIPPSFERLKRYKPVEPKKEETGERPSHLSVVE